MKHFRMLAAGLCSAVLLCGSAIPAYAYSDSGNEEPPVVEETPAPEPAPTITPGEGFSEDGNLVTRDLLYDAAINTFKELEEFCLKNKSVISIYDEYGRRYTWKQYFERVYEHSQQKKEPRKWIYDIDSVFPNCGPRLQNVSCTEQEAEIYIPFCHREYNEKEKLAKERFHVHERLWCKERYWEDPDYPFDWTEGEFC